MQGEGGKGEFLSKKSVLAWGKITTMHLMADGKSYLRIREPERVVLLPSTVGINQRPGAGSHQPERRKGQLILLPTHLGTVMTVQEYIGTYVHLQYSCTFRPLHPSSNLDGSRSALGNPIPESSCPLILLPYAFRTFRKKSKGIGSTVGNISRLPCPLHITLHADPDRGCLTFIEGTVQDVTTNCNIERLLGAPSA
ncbi:hypothetical protein M501DRAFT_38894 [Patellaria atrata CBS 101060]|uniref:Uncharacterized protein n=1 Tax=Patellaria atrata CBS 101060 TaxID=1346257 RepID=A0A9P4SI13_9PEZI|nr:hypothetical protein M501DRAFT_38894 [Patellaria atrata CBS 101060]